MGNVFNGAYRFAGIGLETWITSKVRSLHETFQWVPKMNADLSGWDTSKVITLFKTFKHGGKITGLRSWDISSTTSMESTFQGASAMTNIDISRWDVAKVTTMTSVFSGTVMSSCNRRRIADAWTAASDPGGSAFAATSYDTDWATDVCPPLTDVQFKEASCKLLPPTAPTLHSPACCSTTLYLSTTRCFVPHAPACVRSLAPLPL